jgi:hypothetical protein
LSRGGCDMEQYVSLTPLFFSYIHSNPWYETEQKKKWNGVGHHYWLRQTHTYDTRYTVVWKWICNRTTAHNITGVLQFLVPRFDDRFMSITSARKICISNKHAN